MLAFQHSDTLNASPSRKKHESQSPCMVIIPLSTSRPLNRPLICFNLTTDPCNQCCCHVSHQTWDRPQSFRISTLRLPPQCRPVSAALSFLFYMFQFDMCSLCFMSCFILKSWPVWTICLPSLCTWLQISLLRQCLTFLIFPCSRMLYQRFENVLLYSVSWKVMTLWSL